MSLEDWKREFEGKNILIWGYGIEGKATYRFIRRLLPEQIVTIADGGKGRELAEHETVHTICISDADISFETYDLVMKAPGIVVKDPARIPHLCGETQLFLKHYANRTIGITGTKGKSTTTSLTAALLAKKYPTVLVGNIGRACFDAIDDMEKGALAAFEISCHQLEFCPYSPHIGVYLNLFEEHLDHYSSFEKYGEAKFHNIMNQKEGDISILNESLTQYIDRCPNRPVLIGKDVYAKDKELFIPGAHLNVKQCALIGNHNYQNLAVAYYIAKQYHVADKDILQAITEFQPLHHRLENLGICDGICYVNDSISTIGQATIQALRSIENVDVVLVGGMDRGIEYDELEEYLAKDTVNVVFMYASGKRIYEEMKEKSLLREGLFVVDTLEEAVQKARELAQAGHTVLLSPAASSYDHFKNFEQRGDIFKKLAFHELENC